MLLRTAKSCGPDTPTLVSSSRSCVGPTGLRQNLNPQMTVAKEPGHRGEHEISRKTIACGNVGRFRCTRCYSCAFYHYQVHTRPRVQRASGVPHALFGREIHQRLGRMAPRGRERVFSCHCEPTGRANARPMTGSAKQSISPRKGRMDCFAALAMTVSCDHRATLSGRHRPRERAIQYSEVLVMETKSRSVLDTPRSRSMTVSARSEATSNPRDVIPG